MNFLSLTLGQTLKIVLKFDLLKSEMMQRNQIVSGSSWIVTSCAFVSSLILSERILKMTKILSFALSGDISIARMSISWGN